MVKNIKKKQFGGKGEGLQWIWSIIGFILVAVMITLGILAGYGIIE